MKKRALIISITALLILTAGCVGFIIFNNSKSDKKKGADEQDPAVAEFFEGVYDENGDPILYDSSNDPDNSDVIEYYDDDEGSIPSSTEIVGLWQCNEKVTYYIQEDNFKDMTEGKEYDYDYDESTGSLALIKKNANSVAKRFNVTSQSGGMSMVDESNNKYTCTFKED